MKKISLVVWFVLSVSYFLYAQTKLIGRPVENPGKVLQNFMNFLYYNRDYLRLADDDYKAYDNNGTVISKGEFLDTLSKGKYLPMRLNSKTETYQLYRLPNSVDKDVSATIAQYATTYADAYKKEGMRLPAYRFIDLNGKIYTSENTLGKILVLKCWFLACQACREEIPQLNELADRYKNRKDILFVSLVFDQPKAIKAFLKKTAFNYAIVPNKEAYMDKILKVHEYPTHFVIDKQGYIVKMVNEPGELITTLTKEAAKKQANSRRPVLN